LVYYDSYFPEYYLMLLTLLPNMRLQATAQLAAKIHAASLASLAAPPQKSSIM
jgi:hypothetical protein